MDTNSFFPGGQPLQGLSGAAHSGETGVPRRISQHASGPGKRGPQFPDILDGELASGTPSGLAWSDNENCASYQLSIYFYFYFYYFFF